MKYGVAIFFTDYSISPVDMGTALEARGFESLWAPEHSHIPLTRKSAYPKGGELPKEYYDVMDPFVTLAAAATATKTLKVGTGICLVVQRDPIQTAKSVASLDRISDGRFLFGIGAGWNEDEMANHGTTDFKGRFKLMEERVQAMREIWSKTKPEFDGAHVKFGPMMTWPKPVQKPLPVLVGGEWPHGARRALAFGDAWMPHALRPAYGENDVLMHLPAFREMAKAAGRESIPITAFNPPAKPDTLQRYRDAGIERVVFSIAAEDKDKTLATLDRLAGAMKQTG
ncbi:MAG TPA: LLM class F420-dependent oxidoreductase [Burkholderiales bacterium]|nr:LLM class F420-dependent oxidoreductase [Burkholderiales bacterium]